MIFGNSSVSGRRRKIWIAVNPWLTAGVNLWLTVIFPLTEGAVPETDHVPARTRVYCCSFCGKRQTEVKCLIAGPGLFICDGCVRLCQEIIDRKGTGAEAQAAPNPLLPENAATEKLLSTLGGYNGAAERIDAAMQGIVDILREREVSWAAIGQALAVSRQAAWKRFG